jgi:5-formyltetrahydrofolate cyclo-ligase
MTFHPVERESDLLPGRFGIPEPDGDDGGQGEAVFFELVVVPGMAFDRDGYRLGRGGGYYDRFLSAARFRAAVGLAFAWQLLPELPRDPWDVPVGAVATEEGVIRAAGAGSVPRAWK